MLYKLNQGDEISILGGYGVGGYGHVVMTKVYTDFNHIRC